VIEAIVMGYVLGMAVFVVLCLHVTFYDPSGS
jgi:hypothetical protein